MPGGADFRQGPRRAASSPPGARSGADRRSSSTAANTTADLIPDGIRFHDLHHTHATALIAGGASIKAVSRRLGHADIAITLRVYSHCLPDDDAKLASQAGTLFG